MAIKIGDSFADGEELEVKETSKEDDQERDVQDSSEEEEKETPEESSASKESSEENPEDEEELVETEQEKTSKEEKLRALQGLETEERDIDSEIEQTRQRIVQKRASRRELRSEEKSSVPAESPVVEDLSGVDPEQVELLEKVLKVKGYVKKDELASTRYEDGKNNETSKFLERHPEYKPENDKDDKNWNRLQEELAYYAKPAESSKIGLILEKAHKAISGKSVSSPAQLAAKTEKLKQAGQGVGARGVAASSKKSSSGLRVDMLRGFTEEDLKEITSE